MRSSNGGKHGLAGWGFRGFPEAGAGLRADDGADFISDAGSCLTAANLRLAKLRSVSEFSGAEGFSLLLGGKARRPAVRCHGRAFQADQARRTARSTARKHIKAKDRKKDREAKARRLPAAKPRARPKQRIAIS